LENYLFNIIVILQNKVKEVIYMSVKIRLRRMGAKKAPFYRIVVADSRSPRDGRFIEELGYYNPTTDPTTIKFDEEKAVQWIKNGAQPTEIVKKIFAKSGLDEKAGK
jgi:small subunit ribosomal protein S16